MFDAAKLASKKSNPKSVKEVVHVQNNDSSRQRSEVSEVNFLVNFPRFGY